MCSRKKLDNAVRIGIDKSSGSANLEWFVEDQCALLRSTVAFLFVGLTVLRICAACVLLCLHPGQVDDEMRMIFVAANFSLETTQAERVTMEEVAKAKASAGDSATDAHMTSVSGPREHSRGASGQGTTIAKRDSRREPRKVYFDSTNYICCCCCCCCQVSTSLRALSNRAATLEKYLVATTKGDIPPDQKLLRQVAAIANALPAADVNELDGSRVIGVGWMDEWFVNGIARRHRQRPLLALRVL